MLALILAHLLAFSPILPAEEVQHSVTQQTPAAVLYYTHYCPYSRQVLNYLKQIHKTVPMKNVAENPEAKMELKTLGGRLEVPCLILNGEALYNSDTIIDWMARHQDELEHD